MDVELSYLFTNLNNRSLTHPNIVKLWKCYLNKKVERLNNSCGYEYYIERQLENLNMAIIKCNNAIESMTYIKDLTPETLLTLLTLQRNIT